MTRLWPKSSGFHESSYWFLRSSDLCTHSSSWFFREDLLFRYLSVRLLFRAAISLLINLYLWIQQPSDCCSGRKSLLENTCLLPFSLTFKFAHFWPKFLFLVLIFLWKILAFHAQTTILALRCSHFPLRWPYLWWPYLCFVQGKQTFFVVWSPSKAQVAPYTAH